MMPRRKVGEYDERLAAMMASMDAHIKADAQAFEALAKQIIEVNMDVKSIIASRNFAAGVWKALSLLGAGLVAFATLYLMWKAIRP